MNAIALVIDREGLFPTVEEHGLVVACAGMTEDEVLAGVRAARERRRRRRIEAAFGVDDQDEPTLLVLLDAC